jgi:hypothetical protein
MQISDFLLSEKIDFEKLPTQIFFSKNFSLKFSREINTFIKLPKR